MKAYIFDLDGTISDSVPLIVATALEVCEHFGLKHDEEKLKSYIGISLFETGEDLLGKGRGQEYMDTYHEYYYRNARKLCAFPGILDMLAQLQQKGAKLALCTAKRRHAALESLEQIGADKFMDAVVYSELTQRHKPFPDPALLAASKLGEPISECLFIGDAKHDIGCAHNAGMQVCGVTWGAGSLQEIEENKPDYIVHSVPELEQLLLQLLQL